MTINYALDAKERIKTADYRDFSVITQAIDKSKLEKIIKTLPMVKGFRSGKDTEIRLKRYFGRSSSWEEQDWSLLQNLWLTYTEHHNALQNILGFHNKEMLENIIEELLNSSEKRQEIIEKAISLINTENITQKHLKNWLLFSPLPQDEVVERLLSFVPKESPVELKAKISSLENQIELIKKESVQLTQLQATNKNVTKINSDLLDNTKELNKVKKDLQQANSKIYDLEKIRGMFVEELEGHNKKIQSLYSDNVEMNNEAKNLRSRLSSIIESIKEIDLYREQQNFDISQLSTDYVQMESNIKLLLQDFEELKNQGTPSSTNSIYPLKEHYSEEIKVIRKQNEVEDVLNLASVNEVAKHLEKNLNLLGIKLPHARRLSREIMAAIGSGQLVSFQGSLASLVAERCAYCLTGGNYRVIKIPFGCIDSSIEVIIERIITEYEDTNSPIAIILEGMNRSAFDVYGLTISKFIIERIFQIRPNSKSLLVFGTVTDGPSMLPIGSNYLELGPLLNIDSIKWLDKPSAIGPLGLIEKEIFSGEASTLVDEYNWEDSIIPNWLYTLGGPLWRRVLITADCYGREMASTIDTPFEFSIFGWIFPMAVHLDSSKLVDFSNLVEKDDRLRYILSKNAFGVVDSFELEDY
ncbi:hypothetical protein [Neobacillus mesonae]|uniref:hypothetical protein n=1 Tax=Neobacillus mesonae TaxID=1193713 RepID=UPI00082AFFFC|nr:hypothetical protein [Neobacillus mesonae]